MSERSTTPPRRDWEEDLTQSLRGNRPSQDFLSDLSERLDAEFAASVQQVEPSRETPAPAKRRSLLSRLPASLAAAACVLIAMAWMTSAPGCSWAAMIAAIEDAGWVEVIVQGSGGRDSASWFSAARRVVFVRTAAVARVEDHAAGYRVACQPDGSALNREEISPGGPPDVGAQLVLLAIAASRPEDASVFDGAVDYRVLSETSQPLRGAHAALEVQLAVDRPAIGELRLRFLVDSSTALPASGALLNSGLNSGRAAQPIQFAYTTQPPVEWTDESSLVRFLATSPASPDEPSDVALLAVDEPRDAEVVAVIEEPVEAPPTQLASREPLAGDLAKLTASQPTEQPPAVEPPVVEVEEPVAPLEPPRPIDEMAARIDEVLREAWLARGVEPAQPATDEELVRRVHLDLAGRIPTVNEVRRYLADESPNRREQLIDGLVERYDHAAHLAAVWRRALIPDTEPIEGLGGAAGFEEWLTERFRANKPYDQIVRDLLLAEGRMTDSGPMLFYAAGKLQPEEIARQASRAFLGVRMDCAQCHDDFFDDRWRQEDFWAFAAFFARLSQPDAMMQRVSPVMRVIDSPQGDVTLPDTEDVVAPRFPLQRQGFDSDVGPKRREVLVDWLTATNNDHFARATANRAWATLFGRGLINPLDDMRPDNPPVVPELLDELAVYFQRTGFDLRRLLVTIARTEAYQLSSSADDESALRRELFAQMNLKPFTPEQLYDGIATATRVRTPAAAPTREAFPRTRDSGRQAFLAKFKTTGDDATVYQSGITQALTLMNGGLTGFGTELQTSGLLRSLKAPFLSDEQRVEILFLATVSRPPRPAESEAILPLLEDASTADQRSEVLGDALWALLNSAEFTLNH